MGKPERLKKLKKESEGEIEKLKQSYEQRLKQSEIENSKKMAKLKEEQDWRSSLDKLGSHRTEQLEGFRDNFNCDADSRVNLLEPV